MHIQSFYRPNKYITQILSRNVAPEKGLGH